nr:hypothetical protein [Fredinandcohnia onubensis]
MGFGRFLKKAVIPGYNAFDMAKKVKDNGLVGGIKERIREDVEDTPGVSQIYQAGKHEGKKEGYAEASYEYEQKLLRQAEAFLKQKNHFEFQKQEYEDLIDDYETYIDEMTQKENLTAEQSNYLQQIMVMERKLKKAM